MAESNLLGPGSGSVVLPLNRPEYVGGPEALLSSIAWSCAKDPSSAGRWTPRLRSADAITPSTKTLAITYDEVGVSAVPRTLQVIHLSRMARDEWREEITQNLDTEYLGLDEVLAEAIRGVLPTKGKTVPATPLTLHMSLLQNSSGMKRKANPYNVAAALEQMFVLGRKSGSDASVGSLWRHALNYRMELDPLLQVLDQASADILGAVFTDLPIWSDPEAPSDAARWTGFLPSGTPFSWFSTAWSTLLTEEWSRVLPARVWADWATAVLRLALGFSYLWEAAWYERLAEALVTGQRGITPAQLADGLETMPWRSRGDAVSVRDVVAPMRARIGRGVSIADRLRKWSVDGPNGTALVKDLSFSDGMRALETDCARPDSPTRTMLLEGMTGSRLDNVWEAVRYALASRRTSGSQADFYGLLRNNGPRFAVVAPGTELTALVAGLACGTPGSTTTLAQVVDQLAHLGTVPPLAELVSILEESGLARGSADADLAVQVQSPF